MKAKTIFIRVAWLAAAFGTGGCGGGQAAGGGATAAEARARCPQDVVGDTDLESSVCLDTSVLAGEVVRSCGEYLETRAWRRDVQAEMYAYQQFGRQFACYRAMRSGR